MYKSRKTIWTPLILGTFATVVAITVPSVTVNEGQIWYFPLYQPTWLQNIQLIGSFLWLYFYAWFFDEFTNFKFNDKVYDFVSEQSMWAYLSHYLWIVVVQRIICRPFKLSLFWTIVCNFVFGYSLILLSFILLKWITSKICAKKKKPIKGLK